MRLGVVAAVAIAAAVAWFWPEISAFVAQGPPVSRVQGVSRGSDRTQPPPELRTEREITGRVVGVADGDTLTLLTAGNRQVRVRLVEIDAPESGQPWGSRAKDALSALVFAKTVQVRTAGLDQYGRTLGRVFVGSTDVNAELVRSGAAWAYRQYLTDGALLSAERQARDAKRGLWSLSSHDTEAPWVWRHERRIGVREIRGTLEPSRATTVAAGSGHEQCGSKRYCREMSSCAEARFYLNACGLSRLDGDGDGVPCEVICR